MEINAGESGIQLTGVNLPIKEWNLLLRHYVFPTLCTKWLLQGSRGSLELLRSIAGKAAAPASTEYVPAAPKQGWLERAMFLFGTESCSPGEKKSASCVAAPDLLMDRFPPRCNRRSFPVFLPTRCQLIFPSGRRISRAERGGKGRFVLLAASPETSLPSKCLEFKPMPIGTCDSC